MIKVVVVLLKGIAVSVAVHMITTGNHDIATVADNVNEFGVWKQLQQLVQMECVARRLVANTFHLIAERILLHDQTGQQLGREIEMLPSKAMVIRLSLEDMIRVYLLRLIIGFEGVA